jgi:hypothetical protein
MIVSYSLQLQTNKAFYPIAFGRLAKGRTAFGIMLLTRPDSKYWTYYHTSSDSMRYKKDRPLRNGVVFLYWSKAPADILLFGIIFLGIFVKYRFTSSGADQRDSPKVRSNYRRTALGIDNGTAQKFAWKARPGDLFSNATVKSNSAQRTIFCVWKLLLTGERPIYRHLTRKEQTAMSGKVGKPPFYNSVEEIQEMIDKYFEECDGKVLTDENGNPMRNKDGKVIRDDRRPYTITGLALALGFNSRQALLNYQAKEEFHDTIMRAKAKVERYAEERLYDKHGSNGAKFALANNFKGWSEKQQIEGSINTKQEITVELID